VPTPVLRYLVDNYRSTPPIVTFFNNFITNDPAFAPARVQPIKPPIVAQLPANGIPVLGMFRPDAATLAAHLTSFLWDVFRGGGRTINVGGTAVQIVQHPNGGDFGDAVVLSHSVNEFAARFGNNAPRQRLPSLMRNLLRAQHNVSVFNPRGQALRDVPVVQQLLGIALDCIDPPNAANPDGIHQTALSTPPAVRLRGEAQLYLRTWRQVARAFMATNPLPNTPHTLQQFIQAWQTRTSQTAAAWPDEWPVLELMFKIMCWLPMLQNDPEGQVYLEAMTRCVAQAATYSSYRSVILRGPAPHDVHSVRRAILDVFAPLAESAVEVDEEIMPHVPRDRVPFMTIHQAKGLEYPLVIVDIASDYTADRPVQRFRRFPTSPSNVHRLEDDLAPYCNIGPLRTVRPAIARTFDDLVRLYYVAYSRAQSVLLLVGCDPCLRYNASIRHVAAGWRSGGTWAWRTPVTGAVPAMANNIPIELI
jgi:DNA helicase-2/ATP-dependent DNA helicase PcrA